MTILIQVYFTIIYLYIINNTFFSFNSVFNSVIILSFKFTGESSFGLSFKFFKTDSCSFNKSICDKWSFCWSNNLNSKLEYWKIIKLKQFNVEL